LLYVYDGKTLRPVDFGETAPPGTCYHLSSADGLLVSIGPKDLFQFDGKTWIDLLSE
jgi:hypothetical protein